MGDSVNVYDFDGTIYDGDSSVDFYRFCLRRHHRILGALPRQAAGACLYALRRIDKTAMKQRFYSYMRLLDDTLGEVEPFWEAHRRKIKHFYLDQRSATDIVISASPVFLLQPICDRLGVGDLIASEVDSQTGTCLGPNCRGERKVELFDERHPGVSIREFYSDSHADDPLAARAEAAYFVKGEHIRPW